MVVIVRIWEMLVFICRHSMDHRVYQQKFERLSAKKEMEMFILSLREILKAMKVRMLACLRVYLQSNHQKNVSNIGLKHLRLRFVNLLCWLTLPHLFSTNFLTDELYQTLSWARQRNSRSYPRQLDHRVSITKASMCRQFGIPRMQSMLEYRCMRRTYHDHLITTARHNQLIVSELPKKI